MCLNTNIMGALEGSIIATESSRGQIAFYIESRLKDCVCLKMFSVPV